MILELNRPLSSLALAIALAFCHEIASGTPPEIPSRLRQAKVDQAADAFGRDHPNVLASESHSRYQFVPWILPSKPTVAVPDADSKLLDQEIRNTLIALTRANQSLRKQIAELETQLRDCNGTARKPE